MSYICNNGKNGQSVETNGIRVKGIKNDCTEEGSEQHLSQKKMDFNTISVFKFVHFIFPSTSTKRGLNIIYSLLT